MANPSDISVSKVRMRSGSWNITVSSATISYAMSGRASAICSGVQISRLAISANRPFLAVARTVASTKPSLVSDVEYHVHTRAAGVRQDLVGEISCPRVVHVLDAELAQPLPA